MENTETLSLNGYSYTKEEVFKALKAKGYLIIPFIYKATDETFPGGIETFEINTYCAVRGIRSPTEIDLWENVAIREFQKDFVKPPLF